MTHSMPTEDECSESSPGAAPRRLILAVLGASAGRALRLHPAQGAVRGRRGDRRRRALPDAAAPGDPGPADQRMARGRQAQQALLPPVRRGRAVLAASPTNGARSTPRSTSDILKGEESDGPHRTLSGRHRAAAARGRAPRHHRRTARRAAELAARTRREAARPLTCQGRADGARFRPPVRRGRPLRRSILSGRSGALPLLCLLPEGPDGHRRGDRRGERGRGGRACVRAIPEPA